MSESLGEPEWDSEILPPPVTSAFLGQVPKNSSKLTMLAVVVSLVALSLSGFAVLRNQTDASGGELSSIAAPSIDNGDSLDADLFLPPKDVPGLIAAVEKSVVAIECNGYGTGFAYEDDALTSGFSTVIITNFHVIEDCIDSDEKIVVITGASQEGRPRVILISWDEENDLALLEIDEALPRLADAENFAKRGWWTMAIGNPVDSDFDEYQVLYNSTTFGNISFILGEYWNYTSATINGGNSGGPLVNSRGELIGINSMAAASTEDGVWNIAVDSDALCEQIYDCGD